VGRAGRCPHRSESRDGRGDEGGDGESKKEQYDEPQPGPADGRGHQPGIGVEEHHHRQQHHRQGADEQHAHRGDLGHRQSRRPGEHCTAARCGQHQDDDHDDDRAEQVRLAALYHAGDGSDGHRRDGDNELSAGAAEPRHPPANQGGERNRESDHGQHDALRGRRCAVNVDLTGPEEKVHGQQGGHDSGIGGQRRR
jgi:hypothetical protein